jgi:hypothetical protein
VVWRQSFWPINILSLNITHMTYWLSIVLNPKKIGIPTADSHLFQIFAMVTSDHIWFYRNKTHHEDFVPNALVISAKINKLVLEHHSTWNSALVCSLEV